MWRVISSFKSFTKVKFFGGRKFLSLCTDMARQILNTHLVFIHSFSANFCIHSFLASIYWFIHFQPVFLRSFIFNHYFFIHSFLAGISLFIDFSQYFCIHSFLASIYRFFHFQPVFLYSFILSQYLLIHSFSANISLFIHF